MELHGISPETIEALAEPVDHLGTEQRHAVLQQHETGATEGNTLSDPAHSDLLVLLVHDTPATKMTDFFARLSSDTDSHHAATECPKVSPAWINPPLSYRHYY